MHIDKVCNMVTLENVAQNLLAYTLYTRKIIVKKNVFRM